MAAPARFRECMRCWTRTRATHRVNICVDEERYPLDLCDEHEEMVRKDLVPWTSALTDPTEHRPPIRFGEPARAKPTRAPVPIPVRKVEPEPEPEPNPEPEPAAVLPLFAKTAELPPGAAEWDISTHARDQGRLPERNITEAEMLWAACRPDFELPDPQGVPDVRERIRGRVGVVVNVVQKKIMTVYPHDRAMSLEFSEKG